MKRILYIFIVLLSSFLLLGCTNKKDDNQQGFLHIHEIEGQQIEFSINKGAEYKLADERIENFDILSESRNDEVGGMVFFFAYEFSEFSEQIEKHKNIIAQRYSNYEEDHLMELLDDYNEDFFTGHLLLFYYKFEPNISENYVHSVTIKDNVLDLNVNRFEGSATAISSWLEVVTIKKEDVESVDIINVVVRNVALLQSSFTVSIKDEYIKEAYLNGIDSGDFKDIKNLKKIVPFTWSINVDIVFSERITDTELAEVVSYLATLPSIKSIGYKGTDFIRVQLIGKYINKALDDSISFTDISAKEIEFKYNATLKAIPFSPFGYIRFVLEEPGRKNVNEMIKELKKLKIPYLDFNNVYE